MPLFRYLFGYLDHRTENSSVSGGSEHLDIDGHVPEHMISLPKISHGSGQETPPGRTDHQRVPAYVHFVYQDVQFWGTGRGFTRGMSCPAGQCRISERFFLDSETAGGHNAAQPSLDSC